MIFTFGNVSKSSCDNMKNIKEYKPNSLENYLIDFLIMLIVLALFDTHTLILSLSYTQACITKQHL